MVSKLLSGSVLLVALVHHGAVTAFVTNSWRHASLSSRHRSYSYLAATDFPGDSSCKNNEASCTNNMLKSNDFRRALSTLFITATLVLSPVLPSPPSVDNHNHLALTQVAYAADYGSMTDEQRAVAEAWRIVDNSYIDRTFNGMDWFKVRQDNVNAKYKNMGEARTAIEKMVSGLGDKYTRYLPPEKYQSIVDAATGNLFGIGVEIGTNKEGRVMASDVEASSPASSGGIKPRDVFVEVDGTRFDYGKATPDDVAAKLRGPKGSKVGVVMERDGRTLDYILTREPIKITSVKSYMSDKSGVGKVGVIRIKSFSGTTADTVADTLNDLKKKGAKAFVLDIRGNPGGLLPGGVDTASLFLDSDKPVVFVVNNKGVVDAQATLGSGVDLESPLVVFVNSNTASAAEVMTAALKENGRATIVGEQTFGKGIVQTIRQLSNDNGGVAVTVSRYETPQHHDINKQGIAVDVKVSSDCENADAAVCLPSSAFKKPVDA